MVQKPLIGGSSNFRTVSTSRVSVVIRIFLAFDTQVDRTSPNGNQSCGGCSPFAWNEQIRALPELELCRMLCTVAESHDQQPTAAAPSPFSFPYVFVLPC